MYKSDLNQFRFQGNFTDNRTALIIKPDGGEIIKTQNTKPLKIRKLVRSEFTLDEKRKAYWECKE